MKKVWTVLIICLIIIIVLGVGFFAYININYLNKNEIKDIVIENINQSKKDIYFEEVDFDLKKEIYEVDVIYNNNDYEYKINAKTGKIIYTDYVAKENAENNAEKIQNNAAKKISLEEAKQIAFRQNGVTEEEVNLTKTKTDMENGLAVYEIEYIYEEYKFEFDISDVGEILTYEKEPVKNK